MNFFSQALLRYTLTAMVRDRIMHLMVLLMALGTAMSVFLGSAATIEEQAFTVATAGTVLRVMAVLGLVVFISFFIRRAFEHREIDYLLATPITRNGLLFSFAVAFITLSLGLTVLIGGVMAFLLPQIHGGLGFWLISVAVELCITSFMALFFATVLRSATVAALCSLGYYSLSRMIGMMIGISESKIGVGSIHDWLMNGFVKILSVITPRFDLVGQSAWLVYNQTDWSSLGLWGAQLIAFCGLFFACAAFDLRRIQF